MRLEKESVMWQILIKIALTTGMRRGELLGLIRMGAYRFK